MAAISPLRFRAGDTLMLRTPEGGERLLTVISSKRHGYYLESNDNEDPRTWSHDELFEAYSECQLDHHPANLSAMSKEVAEILQADWESWRPELRFEAERRLAYCEYVERLNLRGVKLKIAWRRGARTVFKRNQTAWLATANRLAGRQDFIDEEHRRKARHCLADPEQVMLEQPSEFSVRNWFQLWGKAGRDIRALIPRHHLQGRRTPRLPCKLALQEHLDRPLCVYGAMRYVARKQYMREPRPPRTFAYDQLTKLCGALKCAPISYAGFCNFLNNHYTDFEEYKARYGAKKAFFKFGIFSRREAPEVPLDEVEVDHTLLDIFVRDAFGNVGRPWLTILICRATRCIVGLHISFDVPSYATLARAVLHSICPKDLRGIEGIENDWPCHGVPRAIITDRGLEFLSESFRRAGKLVGFAVVNLPGRCPYLKGIVERFFGTLNIRVLSHLEGTTLCRSVETYNPQRRVRFDLGELTQMIVRWIVDDYHQTRHPSLGKTPMVRWTEQVDKFRVRPVPSFRLLVTQLGETVKRKVGNTGISWENHTYASDQLEKLRYRRGGLKKDWEIRIDPYDRGEVFVLDEDRRTWISVPCTQQKTSRGITKFQMRLHMRIARRMTPAGEEVTPAIIEKAMEICATKARKGRARQAQRYLADGALATAVCAKLGFRAVANSNEPATPVAEPVSEMPATVTTPAKPLSSRQQGSLDDLLAARLRRGKAAA